MIKPIIISIFLLLVLINCNVFAHSQNDKLIYLNSPLSFQHGVSSNPNRNFSSIDFNLNLVLLNVSANYQSDAGYNAYIGLGFISFLQAQYGYSFRDSKELLRIRSDIPMVLLDEESSILKNMSLGLFYETSTEKHEKLNKFGFSIGINTMILINN